MSIAFASEAKIDEAIDFGWGYPSFRELLATSTNETLDPAREFLFCQLKKRR